MILTPQQTNELLEIIEKNQLVVIGKELGKNFLTHQDELLLEKYGVDVDHLYDIRNDTLNLQFQLGLLAESLYKNQVSKLTYDQLKDYVSHGDYIPLTAREEATLAAIKNQTFTDLKKLGNKIFQDVNQVLTNRSLEGQRDFIREELKLGTLDKATVTEIAHKIAEKTGDWSRDFERIIAFNSHLIFEEGKAAMIQRNAGKDEDPIVYKSVFEGACEHCVRLYLTNGIGSQPKLFKLSELRANGSNIGRSVKDWVAVIGPIHPYCRCLINQFFAGYVWNDKTKQFNAPKKEDYVMKRKPIRVTIAGKEALI